MLSEALLHDLVASACPLSGGVKPLAQQSEAAAWPNMPTFTTADGKLYLVEVSPSATAAQLQAATAVFAVFNYATVESTLGQIRTLESNVTNRIRDEAAAGDATINPSFCGGIGGTAAQHIAWAVTQKATLRATLPKRG